MSEVSLVVRKPVRYKARSDLPAKTDVTIIGAGIAGLALARRLAAEGVDHCIIEECSTLGLGISGGQIGSARIGLADNFRLHNSLGAAESSALLKLFTARMSCLSNRVSSQQRADLSWQPIHVNGRTEALTFTPKIVRS